MGLRAYAPLGLTAHLMAAGKYGKYSRCRRGRRYCGCNQICPMCVLAGGDQPSGSARACKCQVKLGASKNRACVCARPVWLNADSRGRSRGREAGAQNRIQSCAKACLKTHVTKRMPTSQAGRALDPHAASVLARLAGVVGGVVLECFFITGQQTPAKMCQG